MTGTEQTRPVEAWEDGRRQEPGDGRAELWHFEASLTDGTALALGFCLVGLDPHDPDRFQTVVNVMVTTPDGAQHEHAITGAVRSDEVGTERCLLPFGRCTADGDLQRYAVHVDTDDGSLVLDLRYDAQTEAFRPRIASPVSVGEDQVRHFSDLIIARCAVSGSITLNVVYSEVAGVGTHDHQWFDANPHTTWHHWIWGRIATEHYTAVLFDLVTSADLGLRRVPVFGLFDADGTLIFESDGSVDIDSTTSRNEESDKDPRRATYRFRNADRTVMLRFEHQVDLVSKNLYETSTASGELGGASKEQYDRMGVRPSYARCRAAGSLTITAPELQAHETGDMIYELNYPAASDPTTFTTQA